MDFDQITEIFDQLQSIDGKITERDIRRELIAGALEILGHLSYLTHQIDGEGRVSECGTVLRGENKGYVLPRFLITINEGNL